MWAFLASGLPLGAQGDAVTVIDISGGSSVYVFRTSRKAKKNNFVARRKSTAKRSASQKRSTRRKVVSESKVVAKKNRSKRTINKVSPAEFKKVEIQLKRMPRQQASKIFAGAAEYYIDTESDYQKAAGFLEEAIDLDPDNKDAKLAFSELSVTLGNMALDDTNLGRDLRSRKALSYFEQAVKNDPTNSLAYVGLAQVFDEQDDGDQARANYEKALELDPTLSSVKAALGYIYYGDGRIEDSDRLISEALESGEDNAEIQYFLGLIRYKQGKDPEAEAALRKSIREDSENAEAFYYLGAVLNRMGRDKEAIKEFENAIKLDPKFVNAWFDLGVTYYNNERFDEAISAFDTSVSLNPNSTDELRRIYAESFVNWAEAYRQVGDLDRSIAKYRIAVSLITDDADLFSTFGFVLGSKGLWKDAITNFEKAVAVQPDTLAYTNLGWAYLRSAQDNHAIRYFDREKADFAKAATALETAITMDSENLAANLNLGIALNGLGKHADAIAPLTKAYRLSPNWLPAVNELGDAYFGTGDYESAEKQYKQTISIDDKFAVGYFNLGKAQHMRGKKKDASKTLGKLQKLDKRLANTLVSFFARNPR